ncbi:MAG: hypothetical protein ACK55I_37120 [bacterium]
MTLPTAVLTIARQRPTSARRSSTLATSSPGCSIGRTAMKRETILLLLMLAAFIASAIYAPCDGSCSVAEEVRRG